MFSDKMMSQGIFIDIQLCLSFSVVYDIYAHVQYIFVGRIKLLLILDLMLNSCP